MIATAPHTTDTAPPTFAQQHHQATGFRAWPRWFTQTHFWRKTKAEHRAVVLELYQKIASQPATFSELGITVQRGQWAISMEALGKAAGCKEPRDTARRVLRNLKAAGIVDAHTVYGRTATHTQALTLVTWLDSDAYDTPGDWNAHSSAQPLAQPSAHSPAHSTAHSNTPAFYIQNYTTENTNERGEQAGPASQPGTPASGNPQGDQFSHHATSVAPNGQPKAATRAGDSPQPKAATSTATHTPPKASTGGDPTAEERALILSSVDNVKFYLWWGIGYFRNGMSAEGLKPATGNWYQHVDRWTDEDGKDRYNLNLDRWTLQQFVSFYWWRVCQHRRNENPQCNLSMPLWVKGKDRKRLFDQVKALQERGTPQQVWAYLDRLTTHFDLIRWKLGRLGQSLYLNENTISHGAVAPIVSEMVDWSQDRLEAEYEAMLKAQEKK
ncbi:hypothetical protein ACERK3_17400 [Phycisphaerales bacterium AB-hyl4]|uniref:Uncharacterized protein n=1 Tax=Natronomicrosphaera hydrolytica TaxID=3242702 RepID=A0ABV4UBH6_9BACT